MKRFKHLLFLLSFTLISFYLEAQDFKIPSLEISKTTDDKIDLQKIIWENDKYFFALSALEDQIGYGRKPPDYFISTIDVESLNTLEHKPLKKLKIPQHKDGYELFYIKEVKSLKNGNVLLIFDAKVDKIHYIYSWEYDLETALPVSEPKLLVEIKNKYKDNLKNADNLLGASFHTDENNNNFAVSWANYDSEDKSVTLKAIVFDSTSKQINQLNYKLKETKNCRGVRNLIINNDGSFCASTVYVSKSRRYEKNEVYNEVIVVDNSGIQKNIVLELNQGFPTDAKLSIRPDKSILVAGIYFANTNEGYVGGAYTIVIDNTKENLSLDTKSMTKVDLQNLDAVDYSEELKPRHLSCLSNLKTSKIIHAPDGSSYTFSSDFKDEFNLVSQGQFYDLHYNFNLGPSHCSSYVITKSDAEGKITWVKVIPTTISSQPFVHIDNNTLYTIEYDLIRNKAYFNGEESYTPNGKKASFKNEPPYIFTGNEPIELFGLGANNELGFRFASYNEDNGEMLMALVEENKVLKTDKKISIDLSSKCYMSKSGKPIILTANYKKSVVIVSY